MQTARLDAREFLAELRFVNRAIERRNTIPILGMVRLAFKSGELELSGTNLDLELKATLPFDGDADFSAMAYPASLLAVLSGVEGELVIEYDEGRPAGKDPKVDPGKPATATLNCDGLQCAIAVGNLPGVEDYPAFVLEVKGKTTRQTLKIGEAELEKALRTAKNFASMEETRYYLNGVYLDSRDEKVLRIVATDGHRLIDYPTSAKALKPAVTTTVDRGGEEHEHKSDYILPRTMIPTILSVLKKGGNEELAIKFVGLKWSMEAGHRKLSGKLIDGTYPDWRRVLPSKIEELEVEIPARASAKAASLVYGGMRGAATIKPEDGVIQVENRQFGATLEIAIPKGKGKPIGINPMYLRDLGKIVGDYTLKGNSPGDPVLIETGEGVRIVQMPMRI